MELVDSCPGACSSSMGADVRGEKMLESCSPVEAIGDSASGGVDKLDFLAVEVKAGPMVLSGIDGGKRKRGRPQRSHENRPPPKRKKEDVEDEEEDVCFLCFDGGNLVLCDRKGCPKAYHPACVKRDETLFRSKAKWNCGWHVCNVCQKAAHYMCYLCTYSLCKRCSKGPDYVSVRGNKGFCAMCMKTVLMIENGEQENKEMPPVDFDDQSSWEYLFKIYWVSLKEKLSLTLEEVVRAKNSHVRTTTVAKRKPRNGYCYTNECKGLILNTSLGPLELNNIKRENTEKHVHLLNKEAPFSGKATNKPHLLPDIQSAEKIASGRVVSLNGCMEWASKELLEFVAREKNADASILSQFDVQALLLDYIKRNNLCDPHLKSQIVCDSSLRNLFGRQCMGHFEMLKLLEAHLSVKEDCRKAINQAEFVDRSTTLLEVGTLSTGLGPLGCHHPDGMTRYSANNERQSTASTDDNNSEALSISSSHRPDLFKSNSSYSKLPHVYSPLPSSTLSESSYVTLPTQERGLGTEKWNPASNHVMLSPQRSRGLQISAEPNENQSDGRGHLEVNMISLDSSSEFASLMKSASSSEKKIDMMDSLNLPNLTRNSINGGDGEAATKQHSFASNDLVEQIPRAKPSIEDQKEKATLNQPVLSNNSVQDLSPCQGSTTHLGSDETQVEEGEDEFGGHSSATQKPIIEECDNGLVPASLTEQTEEVAYNAATPTSRCEQPTHFPPSQPTSGVCDWPVIDTEPIELCALAEESVSDLLAEVDAMELQSGWVSPVSNKRWSEELFQNSKTECFSYIEELITPEPGKSDAFSSSEVLKLSSQSALINEPIYTSHSHDLDSVTISSGQSFSNTEADEEIKSPSWETMQENVGFDWGGSAQTITDMDWVFSPMAGWGNMNVNHHFSAENPLWDGQQKYEG